MIHLVLLSGGSGTRLWPLSNDARSKQFLKVLRDSDGNHVSMVQRVFSQIRNVDANVDITIATCASQQNSIESQVQGDFVLILEPERRDTAPAIMLACAHLASEQHANREDAVIVLPIDTYADQAFYDQSISLDEAVRSEAADLVLLGVEPTYPSEKYGYIVPASSEGSALPVVRFKEKPSAFEASALIEEGALWNCGVFAFKLGYLLDILSGHLGTSEYSEVRARYGDIPKTSFDYEVVEKATSIVVSPYAGEWKDLGTWNTLSEEMIDECAGRVVMDSATCENTHIINETGLPLVAAGLKDSIVVATADGILVSSKERSAFVKPLVARAADSRPMCEKRRWGEYRVLDSGTYLDGRRSLTKELVIKKGEQLSYQRHRCRAEVWTVVSGFGQVVLDGNVIDVAAGSVVKIEPGHMHGALSLSEMRVIEVQFGDVLIEEDIERFGYFWDKSDHLDEKEGIV